MASKKETRLGAILERDGVTFRVWAPFADSVCIIGTFNDWEEEALAKEENGYWSTKIENAEAGQEYQYVIEHKGQRLVRNDPRALQLTTTDGHSVIVDTHFDWENDTFTPPPVENQIIYEMLIGTFNKPDEATVGTFRDAIEKLDYLADLGINMIEIMPINSMDKDHGWGYATDYIYAIESLYGGRRGFLEFVKAAHERGIGIILDVVYNHFGPFIESLDLWQFDGWSDNNLGGIYFYNDWRAHTPWGDTRPDFGRSEVQQYILDTIRMWLNDFHVDGFRVDSTLYIRNAKGNNNDPQNDLPDGWNILKQITSLAHKIKPEARLIAEDSGGNSYITKSQEEDGLGFDAQWEMGFPHAIRQVLKPGDDSERILEPLVDQLTTLYNGQAFQRIVFSDSHDTAGNGAARLNEEITPGNPSSIFARKRLLLASTIVLTAPGTPMLLQGQEFLQGGEFTDWRGLDWQNTEQFSGILLAHKHLIALRKNNYDNTRGLTGNNIAILQNDNDNKVLAYHRWLEGGAHDDVVVVFNFSNQRFTEYSLPFPHDGQWQVRFTTAWSGYNPDFKDTPMHDVRVTEQKVTLHLEPYSALILSQE